MIVSSAFPLPFVRNAIQSDGTTAIEIVPKHPTAFATEITNEKDFAALFYQNCPPPSMLNGIFTINRARMLNYSRVVAVPGSPGTFKTALAHVFGLLTHGYDKRPLFADCASVGESANIFFTMGDDKMEPGVVVQGAEEDRVVIIDELLRGLRPDGILVGLQSLTDEHTLNSELPITVARSEDGIDRTKHGSVTLPSMRDRKNFCVIVTYNPNVGQDTKERKRVEALKDRLRVSTPNVENLAPEDYAHMFSMRLAGIPLTTMHAMFGDKTFTKLLLRGSLHDIATHNRREPLSDMQFACLDNARDTVQAAEIIGLFAYKFHALLNRDCEDIGNDRRLGDVNKMLSTVEVDDERRRLLANNPEGARVSLRFIDEILNEMRSDIVSESVRPTRTSVKWGHAPSEVYAEEPMNRLIGTRLSAALSNVIARRLREYPNLRSNALVLAARVTGISAGAKGLTAEEHNMSAKDLLDFEKRISISPVAVNIQSAIYERMQAWAAKQGVEFNCPIDTAVPVRLVQEEINRAQAFLDETGLGPAETVVLAPATDFDPGDNTHTKERSYLSLVHISLPEPNSTEHTTLDSLRTLHALDYNGCVSFISGHFRPSDNPEDTNAPFVMPIGNSTIAVLPASPELGRMTVISSDPDVLAFTAKEMPDITCIAATANTKKSNPQFAPASLRSHTIKTLIDMGLNQESAEKLIDKSSIFTQYSDDSVSVNLVYRASFMPAPSSLEQNKTAEKRSPSRSLRSKSI